ncbi:MAG: peptidoglycan-binding protein [Clostridiales bacterium]|nr:peptidoglycan-binding protein [Clostridiales bacterium]
MVHTRSLRSLCFVICVVLCLGIACSASAYNTIYYGSVDDNVLRMQRALQALGYLGASERDGVFGRKTLVAVCWFQADMNMDVDGIPGDETLTKLYTLYDKAISTSLDTDVSEFQRLSFGSKGLLVKYLQSKLGQLGYYSSFVDGFYGVKTKQAVIAYQEASHLFVDGVVNKDTWVSLFGTLDPPLP